jgi:hypothetical protein
MRHCIETINWELCPNGHDKLLSFPEFSNGHLFCHFILLGFMQMQVTILHHIKSPRAFMCVPTNIIDCCFLLRGPPRNNCWRVIHVLCYKDFLRLAIEEWFLLCVLRTTWSSLFEKWLLLFFVASIAWGKLFEVDCCFVLGRKLVYSCSRLFLKHFIIPRKHTFTMLKPSHATLVPQEGGLGMSVVSTWGPLHLRHLFRGRACQSFLANQMCT